MILAIPKLENEGTPTTIYDVEVHDQNLPCYYVKSITWTDETDNSINGTFGADTVYKAKMSYGSFDAYIFADDINLIPTAIKILDVSVSSYVSGERNSLIFITTFPPTAAWIK